MQRQVSGLRQQIEHLEKRLAKKTTAELQLVVASNERTARQGINPADTGKIRLNERICSCSAHQLDTCVRQVNDVATTEVDHRWLFCWNVGPGMEDYRAMMEEHYVAMEDRMERRLALQTENALERGLGQVSQRMVALETKCTNDVASSLSVVEELLRRTTGGVGGSGGGDNGRRQ